MTCDCFPIIFTKLGDELDKYGVFNCTEFGLVYSGRVIGGRVTGNHVKCFFLKLTIGTWKELFNGNLLKVRKPQRRASVQ
jgi:hypothetical protein